MYVPGNHDVALRGPDLTWMPLRTELPIPGPQGCDNIDGRLVEHRGLRIAGLGGSLRYKEGPNQYTQARMGWRALRFEFRIRLKRVRARPTPDCPFTHPPPPRLPEPKNAVPVRFLSTPH